MLIIKNKIIDLLNNAHHCAGLSGQPGRSSRDDQEEMVA